MTGAKSARRYRAALRWGQRLTAWTVNASSREEARRLAEADPQVTEWGPDAVLTVTPCDGAEPDPERLFNCCTGLAAPDWSGFRSLELGGCIPHEDWTEGGATAEAARFFTVYARDAEGLAEAITDTAEGATLDDGRALLAELAALSGLPAHECPTLHGGAELAPDPAPRLYVVRDNRLDVDACEPVSREEAGRLATARTLEAGERGEPVATRSGLDRFTVRAA